MYVTCCRSVITEAEASVTSGAAAPSELDSLLELLLQIALQLRVVETCNTPSRHNNFEVTLS